MNRLFSTTLMIILFFMAPLSFAAYPGTQPGNLDLCAGVYSGSFTNNQPASFSLAHTNGNNITVTVSYQGQLYQGEGTCDPNTSGAHLEFDLRTPDVVKHIADITTDGHMSGYEVNGLHFNLSRAESSGALDLCQGTYTGSYWDGRALAFVMGHIGLGGNNVAATVYVMGIAYPALGVCNQGPNGATLQLNLQSGPAIYFANISADGHMSGYQNGQGYSAVHQ